MKLKTYKCWKCGSSIEAIKNSTVICTKCGRTMWPEETFKNEDLIREEMIINFKEQLKENE